MKKFLKKIFFFIFPLVLLCAFLVFTISGYTDDINYYKFSSSKSSSMILGTSRALQGLIPQIIDSVTERKDLLNFAFTLGNSPYGKVYLNAVKKKIDRSKNNGVFILAVGPGAISSISDQPNDETTFRENDRELGNLHFFSLNPNIEYIYKYIKPKTMVNGLLKKYHIVNYTSFNHKDGWLEMFIPMDENTVNQRIKFKVKDYSNSLKTYQFSNKRLLYLEETISFLKDYGEVFLVRLPVHAKILELENKLMPEFDLLMNELTLKHKVPYINFTLDSIDYSYTDGNHLYKESSKKVSIKLGEIIKENLKN